ncbi:VCBS repeat-containing protein [Desulfonema ishimotonii]|uniref:VCBS repeat-containing protein n=1 Tax=Desulfonema ishimotonii TaxID=45657 RepID=A0A401G3Z7_9BACT|nr:VCBS repeat-containing protein [Desulfonema ishimotonii]GBC63968.1 VCBS repeat-containing protein [Desulfonema ishimotonii]
MPYSLFHTRYLSLLIGLMIFAGGPARAGVIGDVVKDFKPVPGYVVKVQDDGYLIDLNAKQGIATGDLFTVIRPGENITHPVSGKVIGTLDAPKGVLRVIQMKSGYSRVRVLGEGAGIRRGDPIRRYDTMPALFWDYTGSGEALFLELRNALPALKWERYEAAQAGRPSGPGRVRSMTPGVIFILHEDRLEVRDSEFQKIRAYDMAGAARQSAPAVRPAGAKEKPSPPQITFAPEFQHFQRISDLPGVTAMADFIRYDGKLLMAEAGDARLSVSEVGETLSRVAGTTLVKGTVYSIRWWQPTADAPPCLAATIWYDDAMQSAVFALRGETLEAVGTYIPHILGTFDRDGDGRPETLLQQRFDRDTFWARGGIRELRMTDGALRAVETTLNLPAEFTVTGSLMADLNGDSRPDAVFVRGRSLYIYSGSQMLYRTPGMGGSLSAITYALNPGQQAVMTRTAAIEIAPAVADLDGDGRPELIAVAATRAAASAPGIYSGFRNSQLAVFKFQNGAFVKGTLGDQLSAPIQGIGVDGNRLFFVESTPANLAGKGGQSSLHAYVLER